MLETLASALQASELSQTLRSSTWLYPLVNTGHVVGIALLFGAITPLDLRLMGLGKSVPLHHLARMLIPVSIIGIVLALATGCLLFVTRPLDYIVVPLFGVKMVLVCAAVINALALGSSRGWGLLGVSASEPRPAWRMAGVLSILLWLGVITAGRLVGYR